MQKNPKLCPHLTPKILKNLQTLKKIPKTCEIPCHTETQKKTPIWVCLNCLKSGCSRYSENQCMLKHNEKHKHSICYNFDQNLLWCYKCDDCLHEMLSEGVEFDETRLYKDFEDLLEKFDRCVFNLKKRETEGKVLRSDVEVKKILEKKNLLERGGGIRNVSDQIFGLKNLGNTCFFNSVMQAILNSGKFLDFINEYKSNFNSNSLPIEILKIMRNSQKSRNPKLVFRGLIKKNRKYGYYNQQDANECFLFLLEELEKYFTKSKISKDHPFTGYYIYQTKCMQCDLNEYFFEQSSMLMLDLNDKSDHEKTKNKIYEEIQKLKSQKKNIIPIKNENITKHKFVTKSGFDLQNHKIHKKLIIPKKKSDCSQLQFLFQKYFDFNIYSKKKHNFICEKCKDSTTYAFKKYYIFSPPPLLVVCLKRFSQSSFFSFKKSQKSVKIDKILDLTDFGVFSETPDLKDRKIFYELYAAVHHSGGLGGGHYTAFVRKESGKWYYVSDSHYSETSVERVLKSEPYMLYYRLVV